MGWPWRSRCLILRQMSLSSTFVNASGPTAPISPIKAQPTTACSISRSRSWGRSIRRLGRLSVAVRINLVHQAVDHLEGVAGARVLGQPLLVVYLHEAANIVGVPAL